MADDQMPKVDLTKDKNVNKGLLQYMKAIEQQNLERVEKFRRIRKGNILTGLTLAAGVASIYGYTIWAVKQETFLDDFDEPVAHPPPPPQ